MTRNNLERKHRKRNSKTKKINKKKGGGYYWNFRRGEYVQNNNNNNNAMNINNIPQQQQTFGQQPRTFASFGPQQFEQQFGQQPIFGQQESRPSRQQQSHTFASFGPQQFGQQQSRPSRQQQSHTFASFGPQQFGSQPFGFETELPRKPRKPLVIDKSRRKTRGHQPPQGAAEERESRPYSHSTGERTSTRPSPQRNRRSQANNRPNTSYSYKPEGTQKFSTQPSPQKPSSPPQANNRNNNTRRRRNNTRRRNTRRRNNRAEANNTRRSANVEDSDICVKLNNIADIIINTYRRYKDNPSLTNLEKMTATQKGPILEYVMNEIKPHLNPDVQQDNVVLKLINRGKYRMAGLKLRNITHPDKRRTLKIFCLEEIDKKIYDADAYIGILTEN